MIKIEHEFQNWTFVRDYLTYQHGRIMTEKITKEKN